MNRTECAYEEHLRKLGYVQIYDGEASPKKPNDFTSLEPGERKFFIRYYQLVKNNRPTDEYVKLVYDLRTGYLAHFPEHYLKTADGKRQARNMLALHTIKA